VVSTPAAGSSPSATLTPTSTPTPTPTPAPVAATLDVSPNPLAFGTRKVGSRTTKSVTLSAPKANKVAVIVEGFPVSSLSGDYQLNLGKTTCTPGESLQVPSRKHPGTKGSCAIAIDFTPSAKTKGQSDLGQLEILTDAETIKPKRLPVTLKGGGSIPKK
jgi:hypothetical protein